MMTTLIVNKRGTEQRCWQRSGMWNWIDMSVCAHSCGNSSWGVKMDVHCNCCHAQRHMVGEKQWCIAVRDTNTVVNWRGKHLRTLQGKRGTKALFGSQWLREDRRLGSNWRRRRQCVLAWTAVDFTVTVPIIWALVVDTGRGQAAALLAILFLFALKKVINLQYEGLHSVISNQVESKLSFLSEPMCFYAVIPLYQELVQDNSRQSQNEHLKMEKSPLVGLEMWAPCAPWPNWALVVEPLCRPCSGSARWQPLCHHLQRLYLQRTLKMCRLQGRVKLSLNQSGKKKKVEKTYLFSYVRPAARRLACRAGTPRLLWAVKVILILVFYYRIT